MMTIQNALLFREQALTLLRIEWDQISEKRTFERENKKAPVAIQFQIAKPEEQRTAGTGSLAEIQRIAC
jgi:hypothetical protein